SASAPIKLVPQSEWIIAGKPLGEENRLKAAMNVSVEHPVTASRWTADVASVSCVPPCSVLRWASATMSAGSRESRGRMALCFASSISAE
ncbi:hypothetical protein PV326_013109, partial [Microctonus aethiopoides]